jgi:hypothetical protein
MNFKKVLILRAKQELARTSIFSIPHTIDFLTITLYKYDNFSHQIKIINNIRQTMTRREYYVLNSLPLAFLTGIASLFITKTLIKH